MKRLILLLSLVLVISIVSFVSAETDSEIMQDLQQVIAAHSTNFLTKDQTDPNFDFNDDEITDGTDFAMLRDIHSASDDQFCTIFTKLESAFSERMDITDISSDYLNGFDINNDKEIKSTDWGKVRDVLKAGRDVECTTEIGHTCTDSDGGLDYYVKGVTSFSNGMKFYDFCAGQRLIEYACEDNNSLKQTSFDCTLECREGACLSEDFRCKDTDNGKSAYAFGYVYNDRGVKMVDFCLGNSFVAEYYCEGIDMLNTKIACPNGCQDGACVGVGEFGNEPMGGPFCGNGECEGELERDKCPEDCGCGNVKCPYAYYNKDKKECICPSLGDVYKLNVGQSIQVNGFKIKSVRWNNDEKTSCDVEITEIDAITIYHLKKGKKEYFISTDKGFTIELLGSEDEKFIILVQETEEKISAGFNKKFKLARKQTAIIRGEKLEITYLRRISYPMACKSGELCGVDYKAKLKIVLTDEKVYEKDLKFGESIVIEGMEIVLSDFNEDYVTLLVKKEGTILGSDCENIGLRKSGNYCSLDNIWLEQKESDVAYDNHFECESNVCVDGKCVSGSLIRKIIEWFKRLFGMG